MPTLLYTNKDGIQIFLEDLTDVELITDHGQMTGLDDDDHPQYFNEERGDDRYAKLDEIDDYLLNTSLTGLNLVTSGEISASSTVLQAFGKLQVQVNEVVGQNDSQDSDIQTIISALNDKAFDNDVIHISGDELVNGEKTFADGAFVANHVFGPSWENSLKVPNEHSLWQKFLSIEQDIDDINAFQGLTIEQVQDAVATMFISGTNTSWIYDDDTGTLRVDAPQLTNEEVQDIIGNALTNGTNTTVNYNDGANTISINSTTRTNEEIMDVVAALLTQGSNVTLTYNDALDTLLVTVAGASADITQNSQSSDYTLVLADSGKHIYHPLTDNNPRTYTIPANSSVAFPIGTAITFVNEVNAISIAITTDTMLLAGSGSTGTRSLAAYGTATALKVGATRWIISGVNLS